MGGKPIAKCPIIILCIVVYTKLQCTEQCKIMDYMSEYVDLQDSTVHETNNGGLNGKTNQKALYCDDAVCFVGKVEEEIF